MKKLILLCLLAFSVSVFGGVPDDLQNVSVTIHSGGGQGSGTLVTRGDVSYVWTAGHVVASSRHVRKVVDILTQSTKYIVTFDNVLVVREVIENGRTVEMIMFTAEIIRYSDADFGQDLALLKVIKSKSFTGSAKFRLTYDIPAIGTELYHVGSLLGQVGSNSVTTGVYSQVGRFYLNVIFDQISCVAFPGSSGGGVFTLQGEYLGMLVRSAGSGFDLIVPIRRMHDWAKKVGVEWALDPALPVSDHGVIERADESCPYDETVKIDLGLSPKSDE